MSRGTGKIASAIVTAFLVGLLVAVVEASRRRSFGRPKLEVVTTTPDPVTWVLPEDGSCPTGFPIKVKESSGIFHVPGGAHYDRVHPDRCYTNAEAASTDGFRRSRT